MNTPNPAPAGDTSSPTGISLATKTLVGGAPVTIILVWLVQTYTKTALDPAVAAAIGAVGSSVIGYGWHVIEAMLAKAGINPNAP